MLYTNSVDYIALMVDLVDWAVGAKQVIWDCVFHPRLRYHLLRPYPWCRNESRNGGYFHRYDWNFSSSHHTINL